MCSTWKSTFKIRRKFNLSRKNSISFGQRSLFTLMLLKFTFPKVLHKIFQIKIHQIMWIEMHQGVVYKIV